MHFDDTLKLIEKGILAGVAGTAVMTAVSAVEMRMQDRETSTVPAEAAEEFVGFDVSSEEGKKKLTNVVHWAYGIGWGAFRGLLCSFGIRGPEATGTYFAGVWGVGLVMLPVLGVAPPPQEWGRKAVAMDAAHHAVYAGATDLAFRFLERDA